MATRQLFCIALVGCLLFVVLGGLLPGGRLPAAAAPSDPPAAPSAQHQVFLPLLSNGSTGPSSQALIAAALTRGEISAETALIYQVFASFGDARLPSQFHGADDPLTTRPIADELAERFSTLSPAAQATLEPFTIPPYHRGSWWDIRQNGAASLAAAHSPAPAELRCGQVGKTDPPMFTQWNFIDSAGGNMRIWWQAQHPLDESTARAYASQVDAIWSKLATLMRRTPPADGGINRNCRGGDDRLDISLVDVGGTGETWSYAAVDRQDPRAAGASYILLNRKLPSQYERGALIAVLMHTFQNAYEVKAARDEYEWWAEATQIWAINYVDPGNNMEHAYANAMLQRPYDALESLDALNAPYTWNPDHPYGAYLFPWFVQLSTGKPDLVRQSWEGFKNEANSLKVINDLLVGGFKQQWPEFALRLLNRPPVDEFTKADGMENSVEYRLSDVVRLNNSGDVSYELDDNIGHLTSYAYRFSFIGNDARSVYFANTLRYGSWPTAKVQALFSVNGAWYHEDWTDMYGAGFCRDMQAERIDTLIIVISNSEWQDRRHELKPAEPPRLNVTNVACRGWKFELSTKHDVTDDDHVFDIHEQATITGQWLRTKVLEDEKRDNTPMDVYKTSGASAHWSHTGRVALCSGSSTGTVALKDIAQTWLSVYSRAVPQEGQPLYKRGWRRYAGFAGDIGAFNSQKVTYHCTPGGGTEEHPVDALALWFTTEAVPTQQISADGTTIKGSFTRDNSSTNIRDIQTYTWTMTALPPE